jgi:hypothetical protein
MDLGRNTDRTRETRAVLVENDKRHVGDHTAQTVAGPNLTFLARWRFGVRAP